MKAQRLRFTFIAFFFFFFFFYVKPQFFYWGIVEAVADEK